jgi:hypothetical protein
MEEAEADLSKALMMRDAQEAKQVQSLEKPEAVIAKNPFMWYDLKAIIRLKLMVKLLNLKKIIKGNAIK